MFEVHSSGVPDLSGIFSCYMYTPLEIVKRPNVNPEYSTYSIPIAQLLSTRSNSYYKVLVSYV